MVHSKGFFNAKGNYMAYLQVILMFATALLVAHLLARVSDNLIAVHIAKIVEDKELCASWLKYIKLAIYIVGVTGGVEVYRLESAFSAYEHSMAQTAIELYRVASSAALSIIWLLLPVFIGSLVINEVRKAYGTRAGKEEQKEQRSE